MENNINPSQVVESDQPIIGIDNTNLSKNKEVKCGNCGYIGPGEKNRSLVAVILAWICIIFAPIITLIYFVATHTWKCPKCNSTFVGIKNKKGIYAGQLGGGARWILIILFVIIGVAILGILSSIVLASLNSARTKSADATIKGEMAILKTSSLLYENEGGPVSFNGFCDDPQIVEILKKISIAGASNEYGYVCNDNENGWAISSPLRSKGFWCVDSSENKPQVIDIQLNKQVYCSISNSTTTENNNINVARNLLRDEFINGCTDNSTSRNYCVCVFDKMEEGLGFDGLLDVFRKYEETGKMDAEAISLMMQCTE